MSHVLKQKVFYSDTDAYGVVWHGSYLRWLEMGRVLLCEEKGYKLSDLDKQDIVLPVVELNIKYKTPAKLDDEIIIETDIIKKTRLSITFQQKIFDEKTKKMYIEATVKVVTINKGGQLYRSLPEQISKLVQ